MSRRDRAIIVKKKYFVAIIIAIVIVIGIFAAVEFSIFWHESNQPQLVEVDNGGSSNQERISLENAINVLNSHDFKALTANGNYTVHYIHGENIDSSGNADNWILAVKTNQSQFYFQFKDGVYSYYPWNEQNISKPILVDKIIMPDKIFAQHRNLIDDILGSPGITRREIQLENGIYTLTVTTSSPKDYSFDAYSGAIIPT